MKVLFVRFSATGDIVLSTGVIDYFHRKFPEAEIDVLTSPGGKAIFASLGSIHQIFTLPAKSSIIQMIKLYRTIPDYDYVFDLQGNLKSFSLAAFVKGRFTHIKKQSRERRAFVKNRKYKSELTKHVVEKYAEVCLSPFNIEIPELEKLRPRFPDFEGLDVSGLSFPNFIVLHPYASQKNKEWPGFFELANTLIFNGINVVIVGNGDKPWPKEVINFSNQTSLEELMSIIKKATAVVTTDSGPMHISIGFKKPTLAIFGPTTKEFGFYPSFERCAVVEDEELDCRPCHVHGGNSCPQGHFHCMKAITSQQVFRRLHDLIKESKARKVNP
ncbi:MAG: glycosyltransferase family 9 protein [Bdellovibrionales bacterium]|nr:glycosyltransferase family 9 protein [Bdellovibrionales bacterium]